MKGDRVPRRLPVDMRPGSDTRLTGTRVALVHEAFPARPALEVAVSRAILMRVAAGELPPTVRLHRCVPILAFSRQDRAAAGYSTAVHAARSGGFTPVVRL